MSFSIVATTTEICLSAWSIMLIRWEETFAHLVHCEFSDSDCGKTHKFRLWVCLRICVNSEIQFHHALLKSSQYEVLLSLYWLIVILFVIIIIKCSDTSSSHKSSECWEAERKIWTFNQLKHERTRFKTLLWCEWETRRRSKTSNRCLAAALRSEWS
jgi:hypothetical protein